MAEEKIALYFTPTNEGDHLIGLPARDLTESEVAEYRQREPALIASATTPHPGTGKTLYSDTKDEARELHEDVSGHLAASKAVTYVIEANKQTVAAGPTAVVTDGPKE